MRIDIADDLTDLRGWYTAHRHETGADHVLRGAAWMLARVSGRPQADIEQTVTDGLASTAGPSLAAPAPLSVSRPAPTLTSPAAPTVTVVAPLLPPGTVPVGQYEDLGPILRFAAEVPEADLSQPPGSGRAWAVDLENGGRKVPLGASYAERAEMAFRSAADGDGPSLSVDAETLAEVDGLMERARSQPRQASVDTVPPDASQ